MKVRITPTLANEYHGRDVYPEYWKPGEYDIPEPEAEEMASDAEWYSDPQLMDDPEITIGTRSAYRGLLKQIVSQL